MLQTGPALEAAVRAGSLVRHRVVLEAGEFENRRLWLRPELLKILTVSKLDPRQVEVVRAALRRFVTGGPFTVVTAACEHREVAMIGDMRELKGDPPPFVELRFKPPKDDLRFFGRFVGKDDLILTTFGLKALAGQTSKQKNISVPTERMRCTAALTAAGLDLTCVPPDIRSSISNARFL
jgi:hypothetical protein